MSNQNNDLIPDGTFCGECTLSYNEQQRKNTCFGCGSITAEIYIDHICENCWISQCDMCDSANCAKFCGKCDDCAIIDGVYIIEDICDFNPEMFYTDLFRVELINNSDVCEFKNIPNPVYS